MIQILLLSFALGAGETAVVKKQPEKVVENMVAKQQSKSTKKLDEPQTNSNNAKLKPEIHRAVAKMQKFYEETRDFDAQFHQIYRHKIFSKKSEAWGRVRFMKSGASMRWDYVKPDEKVFVIAAEKVFVYDKEARQLTLSKINTDRLSASITFLWGQGKLEREFNIKGASREDLKDGIALELIPKIPDPRFQKIFFLLDPKSYAVKETLVVDPDGSENHMFLINPKTNTGFTAQTFKLNTPEGTQIIRLDGSSAR